MVWWGWDWALLCGHAANFRDNYDSTESSCTERWLLAPGTIYLPETFLAAQCFDVASDGSVQASHSKTTALLKGIDEVNHTFNFENVKDDFIIKLHVKCNEEFVGEKGLEVVLCEHYVSVYTAEMQYYYMLYVEMISSGIAQTYFWSHAFALVQIPWCKPTLPVLQISIMNWKC